MTSPAEERAAREGLPVALAIAHELMIAASGRPIIVSTPDGGEVLIRLPTADELLAMNRRALEWHEANGLEAGPPMTRTRAEELAGPLLVPSWESGRG